MKPTMFSRDKMDYLFHHIINGFGDSYAGLKMLRDQGLVNEAEYKTLLEKNSERLIERVKEFSLINKLVSLIFAGLFTVSQVFNPQADLRRGRMGRRVRIEEETEVVQG